MSPILRRFGEPASGRHGSCTIRGQKNQQDRPTRIPCETRSPRDSADIHLQKECNLPRGSKEKYTDKQKRQAEHIEEGYRERGVSEDEAERRAWATVNEMTGGGKKPSGSGRGKMVTKARAKRGAKRRKG